MQIFNKDDILEFGGDGILYLKDNIIHKIYKKNVEIEPSNNIEHEHITPILSSYTNEKGEHVETMPYYSMGSLFENMHHFQNKEKVDELVKQMSAAINFIHMNKIIHRDIKPENILIESIEPLHIRLTDFSRASKDANSMSVTNTMGTFKYMAPEAKTGMPREESDWYSLGATIAAITSNGKCFNYENIINTDIDYNQIPPQYHGVIKKFTHSNYKKRNPNTQLSLWDKVMNKSWCKKETILNKSWYTKEKGGKINKIQEKLNNFYELVENQQNVSNKKIHKDIINHVQKHHLLYDFTKPTTVTYLSIHLEEITKEVQPTYYDVNNSICTHTKGIVKERPIVYLKDTTKLEVLNTNISIKPIEIPIIDIKDQPVCVDGFDPKNPNKKYDSIVENLPYITEEADTINIKKLLLFYARNTKTNKVNLYLVNPKYAAIIKKGIKSGNKNGNTYIIPSIVVEHLPLASQGDSLESRRLF